MPKTPGKMHMYDMVKIDTIVFEIVWGGGAFKALPSRIVSCLKWPGSDIWDAVCSKTLRGLSQCFATFGTYVLVAERDLYSQRPANIKVVLN